MTKYQFLLKIFSQIINAVFARVTVPSTAYYYDRKMEKIEVVFFPDPTMLDLWTNYPNQFKLCIKNYKHYATLKLYFAEPGSVALCNKYLTTSRGV